MARLKWKLSSRPFWFVVDQKGAAWISTCRELKRNCIKGWVKQTGKPWRYWYRNGYRARLMLTQFADVKR